MKFWLIVSFCILVCVYTGIYTPEMHVYTQTENACFKCHNPSKQNPITLEKECPLCSKECCPGERNCCCLDVDRCTCVPPPTQLSTFKE